MLCQHHHKHLGPSLSFNHLTNMAAIPYLLEKTVAISAVTRACYLTSSLFASLQKSETITKSDTSPVTIADFSAQAAVNSILARVFPHDSIIGEEDSKDLQGDEGKVLRERVTDLANEALQRPIIAGIEEKPEWGIGETVKRTSDELLEAIDHGTAQGGSQGSTYSRGSSGNRPSSDLLLVPDSRRNLVSRSYRRHQGFLTREPIRGLLSPSGRWNRPTRRHRLSQSFLHRRVVRGHHARPR